MTPETRIMKQLSLVLLIGGLLGIITVAIDVISAGPSIDSALFILASMISVFLGGYAARAANVPNRAVDAYPMIFGSSIVLALITIGQLALHQGVTRQFIELFAMFAMSIAIARGSQKVRKSIEAK